MAQGNVEVWLGSLLKMSLHSVHCVIKQASVTVEDPNFDLIDFFNSFPAQASHIVHYYFFTVLIKVMMNHKHTCTYGLNSLVNI